MKSQFNLLAAVLCTIVFCGQTKGVDKTFNDLPELASPPAAGDWLVLWDTSEADAAKISPANVFAAANIWDYESTWANATVYALNDVVKFSSGLYLCTAGHTAGSLTEPGIGVDWATVWVELVPPQQTPTLTENEIAFGSATDEVSSEAAFAYDPSTNTLLVEKIQAPSLTGVSTLVGTWKETPSPMAALVVDITKAYNTKTVAANSTLTWSTTPSVAGQEWGGEFQNSSGATITYSMPTCKNGYGGTTVSSFTVNASGLETVSWRFNGTDVIFFGGGSGGGVGSLTPWTTDINGGGNSLLNVDEVRAASLSGDGSGITGITASGIVGAFGNITTGAITTTSAFIRTPVAAVSNVIVTTGAWTVVEADANAETLTYSVLPAPGTGFRYTAKARTSGGATTFTIPTTYSTGLGASRTSFVVAESKFAIIDVVYDGTAYVMNEPVEISDLTLEASPATTDMIEIGTPTGSKRISLAQAKTTLSLDDAKLTRTGVRRTIYVNAASMIPRATAGATRVLAAELPTNDIMVDSMNFPDGAETAAGFWLAFPSAYNSNTVTVKFQWTAASGSGTVKWDASARGFGDDDAMDQALGTEQTAGADTLITAGDMHISATTPALTIGGTALPDRPVYFQITRDVAGDTLGVDAQLLSATVEYTESSTEPAAQ